MTQRANRLNTLTILFGCVGLFVGLPNIECIAQVAVPQPKIIERFESTPDTTPNTIPDGWNIVSGNWQVRQGVLVADALKSEAYITFGKTSWQNYEVEANVSFREVRNPSRWLSVLVRATNDGTKPWSQVPIRFDTTKPNGMEFAVRTPANSWSVRTKVAAAAASKLNRPRRLKVAVNGPHISAHLDGQLVLSSNFCVDRSTGCVGFGASGCIATFDDFVVRHLPDSTRSATVNPNSITKQCDVVAHRGFSAIAPENTLAAIRAAVTAGATGCEFDVYGCADGTVVLMHDKTIDRTTDGQGPVTKLSLKQLRQLDAGSWKNAKFAGERIPTLAEALTLLKNTNCQPVIEIKMEGITGQVVKDIRDLNMVDQVAVIAFSQTVVREIKELEPQIACAWLCGKTLQGNPQQQADWLQAQADTCHTKLLDLKFSMLSPQLITELKQRGFEVWTWTVNETVIMHALQKWGVDSITTDRPDLLTGKQKTKTNGEPTRANQLK